MKNIQLLNKIAKCGTDIFDENYAVAEKIENPDAIMVRSAVMHDMEFGDNLKAIARAGAGVNNIPLDRCAEKGIVVFNTPGANANAVKELVLCGLFLAARNVPSALTWAKGLTEDVSKQVEKGKSQFAGHEIMGKTLGIIGLGAIGRKVAASAKALGMEIAGYDPYYTSGCEGISVYTDLKEMLAICDFVTLHLPATDSTKGMINKEMFEAMKDGAVLLNFSRDKLVKDMDLATALESGKVSQYVTDFPNDNLVGLDNVILLPHLGASTEEAEDNCAVMAVEQMRDYFENGNIINSVNFPRVNMGPFHSGCRLAVMMKNSNNPVIDLTYMLRDAEIPVTRVIGGRRDDGISYLLASVAGELKDEIIFGGEKGANIISIRKIEK